MKLRKQVDEKSKDGYSIISAPIVKQEFINKKGLGTGHFEYYIQRSIQDYFIKFCESKVSKEAFELALEKEDDFMKTLKLEVEFKEGEWDKCGEEIIQSRIGEYAVIHKIL